MASQKYRQNRGLETERAVESKLQSDWPYATVQRGNGKDIVNVPFDLEIKARADFAPTQWLKQVKARTRSSGELPVVVCRMNGQGTTNVGEYLAFMTFDDLLGLLRMAGYADIQGDSVQLSPERCTKCGSWKLENVPCRTCEKLDNANL